MTCKIAYVIFTLLLLTSIGSVSWSTVALALGPEDTPTVVPPTETPPPSIPTPTLTFEQRLSALEQNFKTRRIEALEEQAENLTEKSDEMWKAAYDLFKVLCQSGWVLVAIFAIIVLRVPLGRLVDSLAKNLDQIKIRFGEFELESQNVKTLIFEGEMIKAALSIAKADSVFDKDELKYLVGLAEGMEEEHSAKLPPEYKKKIIKRIVNMALADGDFEDHEYDEIKKRFAEYKIGDFNLDEHIRQRCKEENVPLPKKLQAA